MDLPVVRNIHALQGPSLTKYECYPPLSVTNSIEPIQMNRYNGASQSGCIPLQPSQSGCIPLQNRLYVFLIIYRAQRAAASFFTIV